MPYTFIILSSASKTQPPDQSLSSQKLFSMSKLTRIGLYGLVFVILLTSVTVLCGGYAIYTGPLAIPFTVLILIGISRKKDKERSDKTS
jgi:hypothetical protein